MPVPSTGTTGSVPQRLEEGVFHQRQLIRVRMYTTMSQPRYHPSAPFSFSLILSRCTEGTLLIWVWIWYIILYNDELSVVMLRCRYVVGDVYNYIVWWFSNRFDVIGSSRGTISDFYVTVRAIMRLLQTIIQRIFIQWIIILIALIICRANGMKLRTRVIVAKISRDL